jgi:NAD(P)-dependent dehydrogenase (short-subunit alcohol dehydrogenase family)
MARTVDCIGARYPELAGKHVVVTGAASGIGLCFARAFARQGARVVGIDNDRAAIEAARKVAPADQIEFHEADLSTPEAAIAAIEKAADADGIDILIANAANDTRHNWNEMTPDLWRKTLGVNLDHQFFAAQTAARGMAERGSGLIILMASVAWRRGRPAMVGGLRRMRRGCWPNRPFRNCSTAGMLPHSRCFWRRMVRAARQPKPMLSMQGFPEVRPDQPGAIWI